LFVNALQKASIYKTTFIKKSISELKIISNKEYDYNYNQAQITTVSKRGSKGL